MAVCIIPAVAIRRMVEGWGKKLKQMQEKVQMFLVPARIALRKDVKITYATSSFLLFEEQKRGQ